ncbi:MULTISPECIES: helix-turn-helix transcriptional regulator [Comamonas]|jgi:transcriptional regulator with XRE-family HTH domain|uniref:Helix-turn-helix transcriptional regulator n=1 Tax=Comamonas squillarum TaxID=2977320 RepID=A0ABY5ZU54_9BURK|nr:MULTISPECIES: helix-turn-helix transcriptional regulator [Comamonas]PWB16903.1 transcriptional regulator [Comamonas sp. JNW]UXC17001.1 helix-turn-helix transcriptional regulator [Comamonas sp. PR12]
MTLFAAPPPHDPPAVAASVRSQELGHFLRARRESLSADAMGLARHGRVRTPGLRREEVAQLAGIGVTWYTKLEQGREVQPSRQAIEAIARALQCNDDELRHLLALAGIKLDQAAPSADDAPGALHMQLLDKLLPYPAQMQSAAFDLLAANAAYERLMGVSLQQLPALERNCLHMNLFNPQWQRVVRHEPQAIERMVAMFRAASTQQSGDPAIAQRLDYFLRHSEVFRHAWERYQVRSPENNEKTFDHPTLGIIHLRQTYWWSAPRNGMRMVVYLPVSDQDAEALDRLAALPAP